MRSEALEKPTLRWLHGSIVALLCVAMLSCGDAGDVPDPPPEFQDIPLTSKTKDCYVSGQSVGIFGVHAAPARLIARSDCMNVTDVGVEDVPGLRNLYFFDGVVSTYGATEILRNPQLESLRGLDSLRRTTFMEIRRNDSLKTLEGLGSLEKVMPFRDPLASTPTTPGLINIESNESLESLEGLESLEKANSILMANNPNLKSMKALYGMKSLGYLEIINTPIPQCQIDEFLSRLDNQPDEVKLVAVGSGECSDE